MHTVTFFITTARSGTQWVYETLRNLYSDVLVAEHEPIEYSYAPKQCLRNPAALSALRTQPAIRRHLDNIHKTVRERDYVEVGFPAFAAAPLLWDEFGERLRLVQLVRHPVRVAASIVTHRWFDPGQRSDIQADIAVAPTDPGVRLSHYAERWADMSAFEKALFYWAEVHLYGLEVQDRFVAVPFTRITFEDMLTRQETRRSFTQFLGLPYRSGWNEAPGKKIDHYHRETGSSLDLGEARTMPEIARLAEHFGYDVDAISQREFQRYHAWDNRVAMLREQIEQTIPSGDAFVLIDDQELGIYDALSGRRVLPFLQRDGEYWGPPINSQQAIAELEDLRESGVRWVVVAWPAFWWLDQYEEFAKDLDERHRCCHSSPHGVIYRLFERS